MSSFRFGFLEGIAMADEYVPGTLIPQKLLPMIGYVTVQHNQMDHAINRTIGHLSGADGNTTTAITSAVMNTSIRLDMMRRLILVNVSDRDDQDRLLALNKQAGYFGNERNRLLHDRPYFYSPSSETVGFFRSDNLTDPQIRQQPPTTFNEASLRALGDNMYKVAIWFGLYIPMFPDCPHPDWCDDARFPWPDILQQQRNQRRQTQG